MKLNPDNRTVELTQQEQYALILKHVVPDYDKLIDILEEAIPAASKGVPVLALILARHVDEKYQTLINSSLDYVIEYAVSTEFTPKVESTE